jgi:hypothetical protein
MHDDDLDIDALEMALIPIPAPRQQITPSNWNAVMGWADVLASYPMIPVLYPTPTSMSN